MELGDDPKLKQIVDQAAGLSPNQRAAFLARACGDDTVLREQVEKRLGADEAGDQTHPDATLATRMPAVEMGEGGSGAREAAAPASRQIGPYKLLQKLGEGGMGVVFMAEQEQPIRRRVALKIIKLGMDTKQVVARFEAERQALAMMDHPSIAKVLDAGATQAGRPYFVMELVRGVVITEYCDKKNLSTEQRLELFVTVCKAVQHAHQKGIVHRDIKPSNVLVTETDSTAVPKVIDFGIAKATGDRLTEKTLVTQQQQFLGTPQYMAPEQADTKGMDVDTRADVYALGVLLYEMLTGTTPIDARTLRAASYAEMQRLICEVEPPKPSTRVGKLDAGTAQQIAAHRGLVAAKLSRQIHGELDWIVMKAIEKDRTRRYNTASDLAADVTRYLNHEPVDASPPSTLYRVKKLARRHRAAMAIVASFILLLMAATVVSTWEAARARRAMEAAQKSQALAESEAITAKNAEADAVKQMRRANRETVTARNITQYLQDVLAEANPITGMGPDSTLRQLLDSVAGNVQTKFANDPAVEAGLQQVIGVAYRSWGEPDLAKAHLGRALELRRRVFGEHSEQVATSLLEYSLYEPDEQAKADLREALATYQDLGVSGPLLLRPINRMQRIALKDKDYAEVQKLGDQAISIGESENDNWIMGDIYANMGSLNLARGNLAEAERLDRKNLEIQLRLGPQLEVADAYNFLSETLRAEKKTPEAAQDELAALLVFGRVYPSGNGLTRAALTRLRLDVQSLSASHEIHLAFDSPAKIGELERAYRQLHVKFPAETNQALKELVPTEMELSQEFASAGRSDDAAATRLRTEALQTSMAVTAANTTRP